MGESAGAATAVASVLSSPTQAADQQQLKMDSKLVFPLTLLLLATIIDSGSGLNCYQCNSYEHALCADPFFHEPTEEGQLQGPAKSGNDFLKPCPADTVDKKHFCRKIYQNVRGDERERACYSTVLEEYNTDVCACDDVDGCNSATTSSISVIAVLSTMALGYLIH